MEEPRFRAILDRYLKGEASPEEQAWLESAYINWNIKDRPQTNEFFLKEGTKDIWKNVNQATRPSSRRLKIWPTFYGAAAMIIVLILGAYFYRAQHNSATHSRAMVSSAIRPGKNRAVLVLANGSRISLDSVQNGTLARESGVNILKKTTGEIVYSVVQTVLPDQEPKFNTIITPAGGQYQVNLPDGSIVWLNAASSLTFSTSFGAERRVTLKGEAYFEISKKLSSGGDKLPFFVESRNQQIEVLGTHFNVNAYADEQVTKTTLLEGSVKINNAVTLKPGQQGRGSGGDILIVNVNPEDAIDWKNGDFILANSDFRSLMRKIARWYNVEIIYADNAPTRLNLGGWISRSKDISSILEVMEKTGKVHFKIEERRITVTK